MRPFFLALLAVLASAFALPALAQGYYGYGAPGMNRGVPGMPGMNMSNGGYGGMSMNNGYGRNPAADAAAIARMQQQSMYNPFTGQAGNTPWVFQPQAPVNPQAGLDSFNNAMSIVGAITGNASQVGQWANAAAAAASAMQGSDPNYMQNYGYGGGYGGGDYYGGGYYGE